MTKYYSNRPDFNSTVEAGSTNGGYITPTSYNNARSEVIDALSNIDEVTNVIRDEHLSYLYVPEGSVKFGQEMPESRFTSSYDTVDRMLDLAKRIHSEVLERIDNKFTKGVDASIQSLNSVNGSDNPYKTSHLSYTATHQTAENGVYYEYETTEFYTLAELLDYKTSPIQATKNFYLQRVSELREQFESTSLEMDEDVKLSLSGGPSYLSNKTDEDLLSMFFEYKQIGDYRGLKYFQWQEDNKAWLEPLEPFLGIGLLAVSLIAAGVSMGAATPAVVASAAAVASTTATAAAVYGAVEGGYGAATGHSLISGTQLSKDDRMWAAAEAVSSVATFGIGKAVKLAGAADDIINAVNRTTNAIDDGISLSHIGYDTVVNGKDPTLSMLTFAFGKGAGLAINNVKSNLSNTSTSRSTNTNINVLTKANDSSPWKMNDLEVVHKNYAAKKSDSENEPLSKTEWLERRDIVKQNLTNNNDFSTGSIADLGEMPPFKIKNTELDVPEMKEPVKPSTTEWLERRDIVNQNLTNNNDFSTGSIADLGEMPSFKIKNTELDVSEVKEPVKPSTTREIVDKKLQEYGVSWDEFNRLRDTRVTEMSPSEYDMMIDIRKSIPKPTEQTVLQKIIPIENADNYFGDQGWGVGGFISERGDVVDIKTIEDAVKRLRLDYEGSPFVETMIDTNGNRIAVRDQNGNLKLKTDGFVRIEFRTHDTDYIDIPIGNRDGTNLDDDPASGNGFIKSDEYLIPEYKVVDPDTKFPSVSLTEGSKLYVNIGGEEVLFGIVKNGTMYYV